MSEKEETEAIIFYSLMKRALQTDGVKAIFLMWENNEISATAIFKDPPELQGAHFKEVGEKNLTKPSI